MPQTKEAKTEIDEKNPPDPGLFVKKIIQNKKYPLIAIAIIIVVTALFFVYHYRVRIERMIGFPVKILAVKKLPVVIQKRGVYSLNDLSPEEILSKMSLEDKVGQMLIVGFWGTEPDYYVNKMISQRHVGGVILMNYNFKDKEQTKTLISNLEKKSLMNTTSIPLFISTDQEGGIVSRVKMLGITELTPQNEISNTDDAYNIAVSRGKELSGLGINVNFSPVLDYITNSKSFLFGRVFNGDRSQIAALGSAMVKGYQDSEIIAVPKHFPGHDNSSVDSHDDLPVVETGDIGAYAKQFIDVINTAHPAAIMIGHIVYKNIDPNKPASLSSKVIKDFLINKVGYDGLIITDDMEMGAITNDYSNADAAVMAVQAGNDILIYSSTPDRQAEAYNAIIDAVKSGKIDEKQLDASVLKVLQVKKKFIKPL
jgi:beta-N-acetylhexosaminidase